MLGHVARASSISRRCAVYNGQGFEIAFKSIVLNGRSEGWELIALDDILMAHVLPLTRCEGGRGVILRAMCFFVTIILNSLNAGRAVDPKEPAKLSYTAADLEDLDDLEDEQQKLLLPLRIMRSAIPPLAATHGIVRLHFSATEK